MNAAENGRRPVPPEVTGALWPLNSGGGWEGGTTDRDGRRWIHQPWQGWQRLGPAPYRPGRVYRSRHRRRARRAALLLALLLLCAAAAAAVWWAR